jgi:adenylate cyclase
MLIPPTLTRQSFLDSLRTGGIRPDDDAETRLREIAAGLRYRPVLCRIDAVALSLRPDGATVFGHMRPFVFQLLLVGNLLYFFRSGNFDWFRLTQLALFLFMPFVVQWSIGNFITASGVSLWGLLAPIGAVLFLRRARVDRLVLRLHLPDRAVRILRLLPGR